MVSREDLDKISSLLRYIVGGASGATQIWNKEKEFMLNTVYKIEYSHNNYLKAFFQIKDMSEPKWKKILKRRNELSHLNLTIKNKDDKWLLIWE